MGQPRDIPSSVSIALICLHGAGTGPWCFDDWSRDLPGWNVRAPDLLQGLDVATATMADYASAAVRAAADPTTLSCVDGPWADWSH